ncbi:MAG TPA: hypothetical protein VIK01_17215 [Polyangiaceae bacterium]
MTFDERLYSHVVDVVSAAWLAGSELVFHAPSHPGSLASFGFFPLPAAGMFPG